MPLTSPGKEGGTLPTTSNSIKISAPVDKVFAYVTDPMNSPEWIVSMMEVKDVTIEQRGGGIYNAGTLTLTNSTVCQRGVPRPQGDACDVGAFELEQ